MEEKQAVAPQDGVGAFTVATEPAGEGGGAGEVLGFLHHWSPKPVGLCATSPELLLKVVVKGYLPEASTSGRPPLASYFWRYKPPSLWPKEGRKQVWRSLIPIHPHPGEGAGAAGLTAVCSLVPTPSIPGVRGDKGRALTFQISHCC